LYVFVKHFVLPADPAIPAGNPDLSSAWHGCAATSRKEHGLSNIHHVAWRRI
jgi:hypothetical protein